jgi:hypothetical protein
VFGAAFLGGYFAPPPDPRRNQFVRQSSLIVALLAFVALWVAGCGDEDGTVADASGSGSATGVEAETTTSSAAEAEETTTSAAEDGAPACPVDEATVEELTGVDIVEVEDDDDGYVSEDSEGNHISLATDGCSYGTASGREAVVAKVVGAEGQTVLEAYDRLVARHSSDFDLVENLGDSALEVMGGDALLVQVGDQVLFLMVDDDEFAEGSLLALATEAVSAHAG